MEFLPILIGIMGFGVAIWYGMKSRQARLANWRAAASELDLTMVEAGWFETDEITGQLDGFDVKMDTFTRGSGKNATTYTRITVGGGGIPWDLGLKGEGLGSTLKKIFTGDDIEVKDAQFDDEILIQGDEQTVVALLGEDTRERVASLIREGGHVSEGTVYYEETGTMDDASTIVSWIRFLAAVAGGLSLSRANVRQRLARNAGADSNPAVRQRNLDLLIRNHGGSAARDAAQRALSDPSAGVRLQAALYLGDAGFEVLAGIVRDAASGLVARTRALRYLGSRYPDKAVVPLLEEAVSDSDPLIARVAVRQLGRVRHRAVIEMLVPRIAADGDRALMVAIADALASLSAPQAEGKLVELLEHSETDVRVAAARALATCGTVAAVEPLMKHTKGFFTDGDLKRAAADAIAAIQSQLRDVDAGRLSVVEPTDHTGSLSLSEDRGSLSMAEEEGDLA